MATATDTRSAAREAAAALRASHDDTDPAVAAALQALDLVALDSDDGGGDDEDRAEALMAKAEELEGRRSVIAKADDIDPVARDSVLRKVGDAARACRAEAAMLVDSTGSIRKAEARRAEEAAIRARNFAHRAA
jgi:hypothetical protein